MGELISRVPEFGSADPRPLVDRLQTAALFEVNKPIARKRERELIAAGFMDTHGHAPTYAKTYPTLCLEAITSLVDSQLAPELWIERWIVNAHRKALQDKNPDVWKYFAYGLEKAQGMIATGAPREEAIDWLRRGLLQEHPHLILEGDYL